MKMLDRDAADTESFTCVIPWMDSAHITWWITSYPFHHRGSFIDRDGCYNPITWGTCQANILFHITLTTLGHYNGGHVAYLY